MRYENMVNFIAELRHVACCRYVILCFSFLVDELSPPEVKKRVCVATHSRFSLYLRNGNKKIKTDVSASTIPHKNIETNDKFYRKVAFLMYTEMVNFRPQS